MHRESLSYVFLGLLIIAIGIVLTLVILYLVLQNDDSNSQTGDSCDNDNPCSSNLVCDDGKCKSEVGGFCSSDEDCQSGLVCSGKICVPSHPDNKIYDERSYNYKRIQSCSNPSDCQSGQICTTKHPLYLDDKRLVLPLGWIKYPDSVDISVSPTKNGLFYILRNNSVVVVSRRDSNDAVEYSLPNNIHIKNTDSIVFFKDRVYLMNNGGFYMMSLTDDIGRKRNFPILRDQVIQSNSKDIISLQSLSISGFTPKYISKSTDGSIAFTDKSGRCKIYSRNGDLVKEKQVTADSVVVLGSSPNITYVLTNGKITIGSKTFDDIRDIHIECKCVYIRNEKNQIYKYNLKSQEITNITTGVRLIGIDNAIWIISSNICM